MTPFIVTDQTFKNEIEEAEGLVLLDIWAPWCGPCRIMNPILEMLQHEKPEVKICKVNADHNPEIVSLFNVRSIPTLVLFKDGVSVGVRSGVVPLRDLLPWIDSVE